MSKAKLRWRTALVGALAGSCLALSACTERAAPPPASEAEAEAAQAGYLSPPRVERVERRGGLLVMHGAAPRDARIRLADAAGAYGGTADARGRWRVETPASAAPRLFTLAAERGDRLIEAEGRLLVLPDAGALVLRPGHGSAPLTSGGAAPRIVSVDVAADGAAAVSGLAQPLVPAVTRIDGVPPDPDIAVGSGATDARGQFSIILARPLPPGVHLIEVNTPAGAARAKVTVTPPDPAAPAFAPVRDGAGWRVAWRAPRGGVQTTYVLPQAGS